MLGNWIKQSTTTSGTGNLTLSSVTGFDTFGSQFGDATTNTPGRTFPYVIKDGNDWEAGFGHMSTTTVLVRDIATAKFVSGTFSAYPATKLSLSGSAADVFCDYHSDVGNEDFYGVLNATSNGVSFRKVGQQVDTMTTFATWTLCWPVFLPRSGVYTGFRDHCNAVGTAGVYQWGLYQIGTDGYPTDLLVRTADITIATGDHTTSFNGGNKYLQRGWYWLAVNSTTSAGTFAAHNNYGGYDMGPTGVQSDGTHSAGLQKNVSASPMDAVLAAGFTAGSQKAPSVQLVSA
jgi:hypothetical protein